MVKRIYHKCPKCSENLPGSIPAWVDAHIKECTDTAVAIPSQTLKYLVFVATANEKITKGRGAQILGMGLTEFLEWLEEKSKVWPE